jgi:5-formyltetrahydrofolate cyclo-ligase
VEPDVNGLWDEPGALAGKTVAYPRVTGGELLFITVPSRSVLVESPPWHLLEPPLNGPNPAQIIPPQALDLLLVPGMAFTAEGHRMGHGKGFYDRYLARPGFRAVTFGICFAEQQVAHLPLEPHDKPVQRVFWA